MEPSTKKEIVKTRKQETMWQIFIRQFLKNKLAIVGGVVLLVLIVTALITPIVAPYSSTDIDIINMQQPPGEGHLLGTDELGRDVFTRLLYGSRVTLLVGISAMLFAVILGSIVGALAGYYGGWLDNMLMRIVDVFLCFPSLILLIIMAAYFETSILSMIIIIGITSWMSVARLVRGEFLSLKENEYVMASIALGAKDKKTIFRHILPNAMAPLIVAATLGVGNAILFESALSFLGIGIKPPIPTWGNMLSNAQSDIYAAPWLAIWPGLMIFITVLSFNFVGDGLRDALDPKLRRE